MSKLNKSEFVICCFCDRQMFDILLCTRIRLTGDRCNSITCSDCRICYGCAEDLHNKLKEVKRRKHKEDEQDFRQELLQQLKEQFDIDIE